MDKKQYILDSMISQYLKKKEAIGSKRLQESMDLEVSSATIRNYFKKILDDGDIYQDHISSGRKPTVSALKKYWIDKLDFIHYIYISDMVKLEEKLKSFGVFCMIKYINKNSLVKTENLSNCFLLVIFSEGEFVISYDRNVEDFLNSFIGISSDKISKLAKEFNVFKIEDEISFMDRGYYQSFNKMSLLKKLMKHNMKESDIFDFLSPPSFDNTRNGVYFDQNMPENMMIIKTNASISGEQAEIMYIGDVENNFEEFFSI